VIGHRGLWLTLLTSLLIAACVGCGGSSGGGNPALPGLSGHNDASSPGSSPQPDRTPGSSPRMLLGAYRILIDETGNLSVIPLRTAETHIDVTKAVFPPKCWDCFKGEILSVVDPTWNLRFTLKNSMAVTGYDVRAILLDTGNMVLLTRPDSYTQCFSKPDDLTPRNPFFIFDSAQGQNAWPPLAMGSRDVSFDRPSGAKFSEIVVVIDASWPSNQTDPTRIIDLQSSNDILITDGSTFTNITCKVNDWQDDVEEVTVDLSPIGGSPSVKMGKSPAGIYFLNGVICSEDCEPGDKILWVQASSGGASVFDFVTVTVELAPPPEDAEWTIMVYMNAANLPDEEDINEMEMSGSIKNKLNIIVLWDKPEPTEQDVIVLVKHDQSGYNLNLVSEYINDNGEVIPPGGLNMADGATLQAFMLWTMKNYPAKHYMIDLWDHGAGIFVGPTPRVPFRNVCGGLSLWAIRDACEAAIAAQDKVDKIDIIGFDVCVLGWIETAYCLRDVSNVVIASENSEPGPGWDYGPPLINLRNNINTYTAEQLAYDFVDYFIISYTDPSHPYHYPADNVTLSACSIARLMDTAVPALDAFAQASMDYLPEYKDIFTESLNATSYWGWEVTDIGHFAYEVSHNSQMPQEVRDAASALDDAVETSMINHGHNNGVPDQESGWTIWFPANIAEQPDNYLTEYLDPDYLEFYLTQWDEFLYAYANEVPVEQGWLAILGVTYNDEIGGDGDGVIEPDETIDVTISIQNTGDDIATNILGTLKQAAGYETIYEIVTPNASYPDLDPGADYANPIPYQIHILPGAPQGQIALMRCDLVCDQSQTLNQPVTFTIDPGDVLVLDYDTNGESAPAIEAAIEANGFTADAMSVDIDEAPLDTYKAVFIALGMYDEYGANYYPDQDDYDAVSGYLAGGGKMYIESGDLWYFYPYIGLPDFCPLFGVLGLDDGWEDITSVYGESGTTLDGLTFNYPGDDPYTDHIDAASGANLVMSASTTDMTTFGAVVAYNAVTYRTIAASVEFGGIEDGADPNTKSELMSRLLDFLGL